MGRGAALRPVHSAWPPPPSRAGCPSASRPAKYSGHFSPGGTFFLRCIMRKYR
jgi:hypothetical protein